MILNNGPSGYDKEIIKFSVCLLACFSFSFEVRVILRASFQNPTIRVFEPVYVQGYIVRGILVRHSFPTT
jgi:hypothetical protein